jgi:hypothetical protein
VGRGDPGRCVFATLADSRTVLFFFFDGVMVALFNALANLRHPRV